MFRLTREVRFAVNDRPAQAPGEAGANPFAGRPALAGLGRYFALRVTIAGELDAPSQYLVNIREIDARVRETGIGVIEQELRRPDPDAGGNLVRRLFAGLDSGWPSGLRLEALALCLSPFVRLSVLAQEAAMVRLTERFDFSAGHRLHNPAMSDEANRRTYGKCNNPNGHGHNYEVEVTVAGQPDERGVLMELPALERIVAATVLERFDHKNLNVEVAEFAEVIPTVENIAAVIYRLLRPALEGGRARLASVTVWETPKTWCEYSEPD